MGGIGSGNPMARGTLGNKGGRKSAYVEEGRAKMLVEAFFEEMNVEEVTNRLKAGNRSLWDVWIAKGLAGNEKVMVAMFKKLFPDRIHHAGEAAVSPEITPEQRAIIKRAIEYTKSRGTGAERDYGAASAEESG